MITKKIYLRLNLNMYVSTIKLIVNSHLYIYAHNININLRKLNYQNIFNVFLR